MKQQKRAKKVKQQNSSNISNKNLPRPFFYIYVDKSNILHSMRTLFLDQIDRIQQFESNIFGWV